MITLCIFRPPPHRYQPNCSLNAHSPIYSSLAAQTNRQRANAKNSANAMSLACLALVMLSGWEGWPPPSPSQHGIFSICVKMAQAAWDCCSRRVWYLARSMSIVKLVDWHRFEDVDERWFERRRWISCWNVLLRWNWWSQHPNLVQRKLTIRVFGFKNQWDLAGRATKMVAHLALN